jgi:hypothetical protein
MSGAYKTHDKSEEQHTIQKCMGEYLDLRSLKYQEGGESCIIESALICTPRQILF